MKSGYRIAIIDDSASVRRGLESLLRSLGFSVVGFASAQDFLASALREFDCIVTDVEMPGLTGIDLYEAMRAEQDDTPVIFITAASEQQVRQRLGTDPCVLSKPFEASELADSIHQALSR